MSKVMIYSNEHKGWWKPYYFGYTQCSKEAGIFDLEDAIKKYPKLDYDTSNEDFLVDVSIEAIDNANPSEALECLETIWCDISTNYINEYVAIKQALQKAQEDEKLKVDICEMFGLDNLFPYNDTKAILKELEEYMDRKNQLWVDFMKTSKELKEKNAKLRQKAQEPKHYLKWEDLEFKLEKQMMTVLLNGTKYTLIVGCNVHFDKLAFLRNSEINYYFLEADKQFFNDLHLERVEE